MIQSTAWRCTVQCVQCCTVRTQGGGWRWGAPGPSLQLTSSRGHRPASRSCRARCILSFLACQSDSVRSEWGQRRSERCLHILWLQLLISGVTITNTKGHVHWFNNLLGPSTLHYIAFDLCYYLRLSHNKSNNQEAIGIIPFLASAVLITCHMEKEFLLKPLTFSCWAALFISV